MERTIEGCCGQSPHDSTCGGPLTPLIRLQHHEAAVLLSNRNETILPPTSESEPVGSGGKHASWLNQMQRLLLGAEPHSVAAWQPLEECCFLTQSVSLLENSTKPLCISTFAPSSLRSSLLMSSERPIMSAMEEQPQKSSSHLFDVYLRLRPATASTVGEAPFLKYTPGEPHIHCIPQASFPQRKRSKGIEKFSFTHIFDESSTQRDVFTEVTVPLLAETVKGRDGMLATLGVTGSGKTHTILGNTHQRGITQLTLDTLFRSIGERMVNVSCPWQESEALLTFRV